MSETPPALKGSSGGPPWAVKHGKLTPADRRGAIDLRMTHERGIGQLHIPLLLPVAIDNASVASLLPIWFPTSFDWSRDQTCFDGLGVHAIDRFFNKLK